MGKRKDDFSPSTVRLLGQRAGYICAYPSCRQLTVGPSEDRVSGVTMVGVAAHITAAGLGGPRYDPDLSHGERTAETNGVWMCQTHGKLVDDTASIHTVEQLKRWKAQHEDWIFRRVANADSALKHGLTGISIENIGPFREKATFGLGRHNVIFGTNGSGKSSICESIAAFSGGKNFESFRKRWGLFGPGSPGMAIEAAMAVQGTRTTVRLSEEPVALKRLPRNHQARLRVEVNGNVAPHWPRSLFNVVYLERQTPKQRDVRSWFRRDVRQLAAQLALSEDQIWDGLREELFCSTTFGYRIRRVGEYRAEARISEGKHFVAAGGLSGAEGIFAMLDIMLRIVRSDPRSTPWIIILDSGLFLGFDRGNKRRVFEALTNFEDSAIQTIVCLNSEKDVIELTSGESDRWIGSSAHGELAIHSFL